MSFNVARQLKRGRMSRLHELLKIRYHADPDPDARALAEIEGLLAHAFGHVARQYHGVKSGALRQLKRLQAEAFDFYDSVLHAGATPDVARLQKILQDMDAELQRLSRKADDIAGDAPKIDIALGPKPPKAWDDPTLTFEEFLAQHAMEYPRSPLTKRQLRKKFEKGQRLNPETGDFKKPVQPLPPMTDATLPTDPRRIKAWEDFRRGDKATMPCFPTGTLVHTPTGTVPIERLVIGDHVLAWDERAREVTTRPVVDTHRNWTRALVKVTTAQGTIDATRSHRFWVEGRATWVAAADLQVGDVVRTPGGEVLALRSVEQVAAEVATHNLSVAHDPTYFVGSSGVLVHNEAESSFALRMKQRVEIYLVTDAMGNVVYVGQSVQGVEERLKQHINKEESALFLKDVKRAPGELIEITDPRNPYQTRAVFEGEWTPYEAAVWEQYFIDFYGGKDKLKNRQDAITLDKYVLYRALHNPCP